MYERMIASPTTARMALVACTSCKLVNDQDQVKVKHQPYQHRREVLSETLLVPDPQ